MEYQGESVQPLLPYGVGIDCHSKFIAVCVMVQYEKDYIKFNKDFTTAWDDLLEAKQWALKIIRTESKPKIKIQSLTYTLESTSTYHLPIIKAWEGNPCVVNPLLAGHTRRKTDTLDANLLAFQCMTGLWPKSFIVRQDVMYLRLLMKERQNHQRRATAITNRINNYILRYGHTLGALKSVRAIENRSIIEDMCTGVGTYEKLSKLTHGKYICPGGIPPDVGELILNMYQDFDTAKQREKELEKQALIYAQSLDWEIEHGELINGKELIKKLKTIPGVGDMLVLSWLSEIVTPTRFPSMKHLAAFCGCDPSLKVSAGKVTSQTRRKGNATLHHHLVRSAAVLINSHKEPFGQWGYNIYKKHSKGGYRKAQGALARRIAVAMYIVHSRNVEFSYDSYNFYKIDIPDIALCDMKLTPRVEKLLIEYSSSKEIAEAFIKGELVQIKGFGSVAFKEIQSWINKYRKG